MALRPPMFIPKARYPYGLGDGQHQNALQWVSHLLVAQAKDSTLWKTTVITRPSLTKKPRLKMS
jgi:hypothetical protein